jgi:hypothetical protein
LVAAIFERLRAIVETVADVLTLVRQPRAELSCTAKPWECRRAVGDPCAPLAGSRRRAIGDPATTLSRSCRGTFADPRPAADTARERRRSVGNVVPKAGLRGRAGRPTS